MFIFQLLVSTKITLLELSDTERSWSFSRSAIQSHWRDLFILRCHGQRTHGSQVSSAIEFRW